MISSRLKQSPRASRSTIDAVSSSTPPSASEQDTLFITKQLGTISLSEHRDRQQALDRLDILKTVSSTHRRANKHASQVPVSIEVHLSAPCGNYSHASALRCFLLLLLFRKRIQGGNLARKQNQRRILPCTFTCRRTLWRVGGISICRRSRREPVTFLS